MSTIPLRTLPHDVKIALQVAAKLAEGGIYYALFI